MRLLLTGRNIEIIPALRQLVTRKLAKLDRMLNDSAVSAQVVLTLEKYRHLTEITVHARGDHMLHGLSDATRWPLSLKTAVEKIAQQAHRLKGKWQKRKRRATGARVRASAIAIPEPPRPPRIVRVSQDPVKPMTVEDAALRVGAGDDAVVVFRNAANDAINILYRRKDGRLGLIEPEA